MKKNQKLIFTTHFGPQEEFNYNLPSSRHEQTFHPVLLGQWPTIPVEVYISTG
jgi:hypothetical protein